MDGLWAAVAVVGRVLYCAVFFTSGLAHFTGLQGMTGYAQSKGVPGAKTAVMVSGAWQIAGALMVLVNWHPVLGALMLAAFLIPTALIMHNYWTIQDPMQRMGDQAHFMKDVALAGAALLYAAMLHRAGIGL